MDFPTSLPDESAIVQFRAQHALGNQPLLLSVGRLSARKGLREFVARALLEIVAECPEVLLVIVGDAPNDALHAETQTPESIRATARQLGIEENLRSIVATDSCPAIPSCAC